MKFIFSIKGMSEVKQCFLTDLFIAGWCLGYRGLYCWGGIECVGSCQGITVSLKSSSCSAEFSSRANLDVTGEVNLAVTEVGSENK